MPVGCAGRHLGVLVSFWKHGACEACHGRMHTFLGNAQPRATCRPQQATPGKFFLLTKKPALTGRSSMLRARLERIPAHPQASLAVVGHDHHKASSRCISLVSDFADEILAYAHPRVCVEEITCALRADVHNLVYVIGLHCCTASANVN